MPCKEKILDIGFPLCYLGQAMENKLEQGRLYDFYGELLTPHQRKIYEAAVYEDLSLAEIAESEGISRQGVHDLLKRATLALRLYDDKLHMIERFDRITELTEQLKSAANRADDLAELRDVTLDIAQTILKDME